MATGTVLHVPHSVPKIFQDIVYRQKSTKNAYNESCSKRVALASLWEKMVFQALALETTQG